MVVFDDEDLIPAVQRVLSQVEPTLALDGGSVQLVGIKDGYVFVQLKGACASCSHSNVTLKNLIERKLREEIHPEIEVVNVASKDDINKAQLK